MDTQRKIEILKDLQTRLGVIFKYNAADDIQTAINKQFDVFDTLYETTENYLEEVEESGENTGKFYLTLKNLILPEIDRIREGYVYLSEPVGNEKSPAIYGLYREFFEKDKGGLTYYKREDLRVWERDFYSPALERIYYLLKDYETNL